MSPNVGNFVHDLVEMAKAMETLPQVQAEAQNLQVRLDSALKHNQGLEENIILYKEEIERLQSKARATEAERDDAEIRFLEADDRMLKLERTFQKSLEAADEVDKLIQSFKPVPPQPEPEPVQPPVPEAVPSIEPQPQGQGESPSYQTGSSQQEHGDGGPAPQPPASQDQSEVNPTADTASTGATQENAGQSPATTSGVGSSPAGQEGGGDKPSGPYTGKHYSQVPYYVSRDDWKYGGGDLEDYYN